MNRPVSSSAKSMHKEAWERIAHAAGGERQAMYGIYASRTLAVAHPEVYLRADGWFAEGARQLKGFRECYEEPTALGWCHMEYGGEFFRQAEDYTGIAEGRELRLQDVPLSEYRPSPEDRIYPEPFLSFVDKRLAPLAVTLKTEGKVVTPLELAVIAYFREKEAGKDPSRLFVAACEGDSAYLIDGDAVWDAKTGATSHAVRERPHLVWNEHSVLYPLMDRDDRAEDRDLARAVQILGVETGVPPLDAWQRSMVEQLGKASVLDGLDQYLMAGLASVRAGGWRFHPYGEIWRRFVPEEDLDIDISRRLGIIREFDLWANRVSPATAHLFGVLSVEAGMEKRMRALSREYLVRTGVARDAGARGWKLAWRLESWGHLWPCGLMEHTIDDAFRSRTGHCVSQSHMISAVLEAAGIEHVVVNFDRGGVKEGVNHHFVLSRDGSFLVDDGIVNFRGIDPDTEDYGPLLSFSMGGDWAATSGDKLYGNISAQQCIEYINVIDRALADRFPLMFYANEREKKLESKEGFVSRLAAQEIELVELP